MTKLSDDDARRLFRAANADLSRFFMQRMATDWVRVFGGETDAAAAPGSGVMSHIATRIEASLNTQDLSGRSG